MSALAYSRGFGEHDNTPEQRSAEDFAEFIEAIKGDRGQEKGQQWIAAPCSLAPDDQFHRFKGSMAKAIGKPHRCAKCVLAREWIGLDIDKSLSPEQFAVFVQVMQQFSGVIYTTASHTPEAPRCRAIVGLDLPAPRADLIRASQALHGRINEAMRAQGFDPVVFDESLNRPEQPVYLPLKSAQIYDLDGDPAVLGDLLHDILPPPEKPAVVIDMPSRGNADLVRKILTGEAYHEPLRDLSFRHIDDGLKPGKVVETLRGYMEASIAPRDQRWKERFDNIPTLVRDAEAKHAPAKQAAVPTTGNAADLLQRTFAPVQWAVRDILPEGISILSGDPKIGKSWLLYQACISVSTGRPLWVGRPPEAQGDALMLALEDNDRRLQRRLQKLVPMFVSIEGTRFTYPDVARLHYATEWPRGEAGVAELDNWLRAHPGARLVVIDTVSAFRKRDLPKNMSAYAADYEVGEMFKSLARNYSCAIVLVMHNRKQHSEDALQLVSGTQGMTGGVDNVLVLRRERGQLDAGLYVDGRDIEEPQEIALRFDNGYWTGTGQTVQEAQLSTERRRVLEVVAELGTDAKSRAITAALVPKKPTSVRTLLAKMVKAGDLVLESGLYSLPGTAGTVGTKEAA